MFKKTVVPVLICASMLLSFSPIASAESQSIASFNRENIPNTSTISDEKNADSLTMGELLPDSEQPLESLSTKEILGDTKSPVKRSDVALSLWVLEMEPPSDQTCGFTDVPENAPYGKAACWMKQEGILDGVMVDPKIFSPESFVTRREAALFIWRAAGYLISPKACKYRDVSLEGIYAEAICWVKEKNIIEGTATDPTFFSPDENITQEIWSRALLVRDGVSVPPVAVVPPRITPGATQCLVEWTQPRSDSPIVEYQVVRKSDILLSLVYRGKVGLSTSDRLVANEVPYQYQVRARNYSGWSQYSPLSATCSPVTSAPQPPVSVIAAAGNRSVSATWAASPTATQYTAKLYRQEDNQEVGSCVANALTCIINGVISSSQPPPLPSFYVQVFASNESGTSGASSQSNAVTPYRPPDSPANLTLLPGDKTITVSWSAAFDGGTPITGYVATASPGGATCESKETSCVISDLLNGNTYSVTLKAVSAAGESPSVQGTATPQGPAFVTPLEIKFDTRLGETNSVQLSLRSPYDVSVDWGDGTKSTYKETSEGGDYFIDKNYSSEGVYVVKILGQIAGIRVEGMSSLVEVTNFGDGGLQSVSFPWSSNLVKLPTSLPSSVTDLGNLLAGAELFNQNINSWNTSNVTNISGAFFYASRFNQPLNLWNTSNVVDMSRMFLSAESFNQNIGSWNTSKVKTMEEMFWGAISFNNGGSPTINNWDTGQVTNMYGIFLSASSFNQPIGSWNTGNVTTMEYMLAGASSFNQPIGSWNTGSVGTMRYMLASASSFNQNIGSWNTGNVTSMASMFSGAKVFNNGGSPSINNWNTSKVTNMREMFSSAEKFNQPIGSWDTEKVVDMGRMFFVATIFNQNIGSWNTGNVVDIQEMFSNAKAFNNGGSSSINNWNTSNVTNMKGVFISSEDFNQPIGSWNTEKVVDMTRMFLFAESFNQNIGSWNTGNVTTMEEMFYVALVFNNGGSSSINNWNTSKVTNMTRMFSFSRIFNQNIGSWNTGNVTTMEEMMTAAFAFNNGGSPSIDNWDVSKVINMRKMFSSAEKFNQPIGSWDTSNVTNMKQMFQSALDFDRPLSSWNTSKVKDMSGMFSFTETFNQNISSWNTSEALDMSEMFYDASAFNQDISNWNVVKVARWINFTGASSILPSSKIPPKFRSPSPSSTPSIPDANRASWLSPFETKASLVSNKEQGSKIESLRVEGKQWRLVVSPIESTEVSDVTITVGGKTDLKFSTVNMETQHEGLIPENHEGLLEVCLVGENSKEKNINLGCDTLLAAPDLEQVGNVDLVSSHGPNGFKIVGWALNLKEEQASEIKIYVDDRFVSTLPIKEIRNDVAGQYPGYGNIHGYSDIIYTPLRSGNHRVCAFLVSEGVEAEKPVGCGEFVRQGGNPTGSFQESIQNDSSFILRGWALDYDTTQSIDVHIYVDGQFFGRIQANRLRRDVGYHNPGYGDFHGFEYVIPNTGRPQEICVYAINAGEGETNPLLGCQTTN